MRRLLVASAMSLLCAATPQAQPAPLSETAAPRAGPVPSAEPALRALLSGLAQGAPDYARIAPGGSQGIRNALPVVRDTLQRLGPIRSVIYKGPGPVGSDGFEVTFDKGSADWFVTVTPDGIIQAMGWRFTRLPPIPPQPMPVLLANLGKTLDEAASADQFSGAVLVARDGKVLFAHAYGYADRERRIPNSLETRFPIASMGKMFTAVAVLQLVQAGRLRLDAPVGDYLPDYPNTAFARAVTLHQLLTHTGGAGDFAGPEFTSHRLELREPADYIARFGSRDPEFEPGGEFRYASYGYIVLGRIVEVVSGQGYDAYLRDHVFRPAGMKSTGALAEAAQVPGRAVGYVRGAAGLSRNTDTLPFRGNPAGGGYSTVGDLLRFADALMDNRLLDAEHTALLTTAKVAVGSSAYAYGFEDTSRLGFRVVGHGGDWPGIDGQLRIAPASRHVIVSLANLDPPAADRFADFVLDRLQVEPARGR